MKNRLENSALALACASPALNDLFGSPSVLFEGILSMEIGQDYLQIADADDLDVILEKTEKAFMAYPHARTEITISAIFAGLLRIDGQGDALDFTLNVAKAYDRAAAG